MWWVRRARGRESVHVVIINHVLASGSWIAGLLEFSSTFVFLSDHDVFVLTASTGDWWWGPPALLLPLSAASSWEDVGGEAIVSVAVATVHRAGDRWLQIVWKWRFLVFKVWKCHGAHPDNWKWRRKFFFRASHGMIDNMTSILLPSAVSSLWSISRSTTGELPTALNLPRWRQVNRVKKLSNYYSMQGADLKCMRADILKEMPSI